MELDFADCGGLTIGKEIIEGNFINWTSGNKTGLSDRWTGLLTKLLTMVLNDFKFYNVVYCWDNDN
uniref:Uncharacterized protein n=1 Tax=Rhizophagus irregularis (strain DAOM 181602 / DAOM 197198 / MUCL 43194) TaxID=747089 RepID=U9TC67_RHIID